MQERVDIWRYCVEFEKEGAACLISHLDLQEAMERALRRARLPLAYSQGFHPRPRMQFEDPLPLGWASDCETFWVDFGEPFAAREALLRLRKTAPPGIKVRRMYPAPGKPQVPLSRAYLIRDLNWNDELRVKLENTAWNQTQSGTITCQPHDGQLLFSLRSQGKDRAPSLKKVLQAVFAEDLPELLIVRRVAFPYSDAASCSESDHG